MIDPNAYSGYEDSIRRVLGSKEGRALLRLLTKDGGTVLQQAAASFQSGDAEHAKELIAPLMENEQAQALIRELNQNE